MRGHAALVGAPVGECGREWETESGGSDDPDYEGCRYSVGPCFEVVRIGFEGTKTFSGASAVLGNATLR